MESGLKFVIMIIDQLSIRSISIDIILINLTQNSKTPILHTTTTSMVQSCVVHHQPAVCAPLTCIVFYMAPTIFCLKS